VSGLGAWAGAPSDIVGGFFVAFIGVVSALAWRCGLYGDDVAWLQHNHVDFTSSMATCNET